MNRIERKLKHLNEKLGIKAARRSANAKSAASETERTAGRKEKRWKRQAAQYQALLSSE